MGLMRIEKQLEKDQRALCGAQNCKFVPAPLVLTLGISRNFDVGNLPERSGVDVANRDSDRD